MNKINIKSFIDREITFEEALPLTEIKGFQLMQLFAVANEVKEKYCGFSSIRFTVFHNNQRVYYTIPKFQ